MVRPICLAVFRLITNSNFVGCCTGKSAGLAPFNIINLWHHVEHLVAEAFLGCYLNRVALSQLQRLQPRRHSLKVGVLRR